VTRSRGHSTFHPEEAPLNHDSRNNVYTDFKDTGRTLVQNRAPNTDWVGTIVLRAFRQGKGAEGTRRALPLTVAAADPNINVADHGGADPVRETTGTRGVRVLSCAYCARSGNGRCAPTPVTR
jgi:hypothetical protein